MMNTPGRSRKDLEVRPGVMIGTGVAVMNAPSTSAARYLITFMNEASAHLKSTFIKSKG